jgi:hypothetical protein
MAVIDINSAISMNRAMEKGHRRGRVEVVSVRSRV